METTLLTQVILESIRKITDNKSSVALLKIRDEVLAERLAADISQKVSCSKIPQIVEKPKPLDELNPNIQLTIDNGTVFIQDEVDSVAHAFECNLHSEENGASFQLGESKVGMSTLQCLRLAYGQTFKLQTTIGKVLKLTRIIANQSVH